MRVESAQRDIAEAILVSFPFLRTVFDKTLLKCLKKEVVGISWVFALHHLAFDVTIIYKNHI
jgi:hypothetical protein